MPFDPTPTERPAISRNGMELAKLRVLEEALRAEMRPGLTWDFRSKRSATPCGTVVCALGLAIEIGLITEEQDCCHGGVLGLSGPERNDLFCRHEFYEVASRSAVTPIMVADELARILAREEADIGA